MTIQWPSEREFINRQPIDGLSIDLKDEFRQLMEACPSGLPATFDDGVEWITLQGDDTSVLEQRMNAISNQLELADFPESVNLLMALACAEALAKTPSLQTWQNVRKLKSHSWQLEHWLSDAMIFCAEDEINTNDAYIKLIKEVFEALDIFQLKSQYDLQNKEREQFLNAWDENTDKLEEIWWGLRSRSEMNYREEFPLFQVLEKLDFSEFLAVVSQSKNPYLVDSVFFAVGGSSKFILWKKLAISVDSAFTDDGTWNNSVAMPLLLVTARIQLLQAGSRIPHLNASDTEINNIKQEIFNLAKNVIKTLSDRQDAMPLFARWSTWLMRQLLVQETKDQNDVRSSAFVDAALVEEIGRNLQNKNIITKAPADAPAWEAWCYRCVLASHAHSKFINPPDCKIFIDEWKIKLDEWSGKRGRQLRERASLIMTMTKVIPGDAAHLLAYPITTSKSPIDDWIKLWNNTQFLREIVEFGDTDDSESNKYKGSTEASKLLWLVFCIGLAILDQLVGQRSESDPSQQRLLAKLHEALALAVREMREIDYFLSREQWLQAWQHLAVRRVLWEDKGQQAEQNGGTSIFLFTDIPTFSDYLSAAKNDAIELLAILQMTLLNEVSPKIVIDKLHDAAINLDEAIATAERLNTIDPRRYPIEKSYFDLLKSK
jgi:hypothetical protein